MRGEYVEIQVELPDELAWAFAQFLKRVGYDDYARLAVSREEAYAMIDANPLNLSLNTLICKRVFDEALGASVVVCSRWA